MCCKCIVLVSLLGLFFLHAFCIGAECPNDMPHQKIYAINKEDNGKVLNVRCGDLIRIELETLGGAGYNWYVDTLNADYVELLPGMPNQTPGGKIGAPVRGVWLFKSKQKGVSEIKMDHYRIWEGKEKAIGHFSVILSIE